MIEFIEETGSTNADLSARLAKGEDVPEGYWLVANRQNAGKGRQGRSWIDGEGNFFGSTVVRLRDGDPSAPSLSFVAANAVFETVGQLLTADNLLRLKWPNDVLLNRCKVAGILLERSGDSVIVGIGVNLASAPKLPDRPTISVREAGGTADRDSFARSLAEQFAIRLEAWRDLSLGSNMGFQMELNYFLWNSMHTHGATTSVNLGDGEQVTGAFAGLDETNGALCLRLDDGTERVIHAGDVILEN